MDATESPIVQQYLDGFRALREATAGLTRAQQMLRPIEGKWSMLEVVCHLSDMETVFAERMKRILAEDNPTLPDADESRYAAALAYHERSMPEELTLIELTRRQMARILGSLPAEAFQRAGTHSTAGRMTLEEIVAKANMHLAHHLPFILEKRRAIGERAVAAPR